jgi:ATP-dependent RNA helicase RhlE
MHPNPDSFDGHGIIPDILAILAKSGFTTPTPIQHQAIPVAVQGSDVIGIAQTGTGKTLSFAIPMIQKILAQGGNGLIVLPTRELALQVDETLQKIGKPLGIRTAVFIGGASMHLQRQMIKNRPHILVATPGRLIDHMEKRTITLAKVNVLVLDEADRMLDMGFSDQINRILAAVPTERQTLLFSATMPNDIVSIANRHMKTPLRIEVAPAGTTSANVTQEIYIVHRDEKIKMLESIIRDEPGSVLVFSRTKYGAKNMTVKVKAMGFTVSEIHSNRSLGQRKDALDGFKKGRYKVLIATDIASRGIDVTGIGTVVNYDLPTDPEDYVHRIGRTGRAGREGRAVSLALPDQRDEIKRIERLIRNEIPRKSVPEGMTPAHLAEPARRPVHSVSSGSVRSRPQKKKWRVHRGGR